MPDPSCVQDVIRHEKLLESLKSIFFWKNLEPVPCGNMIFRRLTPSEETRPRFSVALETVIVAEEGRAQTMAIAYSYLVAQVAIYTVIIANSNVHSRALPTSAEGLLGTEECKTALSFVADFDFTGAEVEERGW